MANKLNLTSPLLAPPRHIAVKLPVGHAARAACTHCSHLFLVMLIVDPGSTALSVNSALPTRACVISGDPEHRFTAPAMPPQIASSAAF